ncbi:hypothetical protein JCM10908_000061 [Rhodotorula pacifica]|uniref:uncharacterized protein n=1 Tax=Rhodotorula pacifica TaxID=1495444 RepID=UPI00317A68AF
MAEAIQQEGTPLQQYLDQVNEPSSSATQPAPASAPARPPMQQRTTATSSSSAASSSRRTSTIPKRPQHYQATTERIKYALATSALLSANLRDALQLYPPLDQIAPPPPTDLKGKGKAKTAVVAAFEKAPTTQWPQGWDQAGLSMRDRSLVGNATAALSALTRSLSFLSSSLSSPPSALAFSAAQNSTRNESQGNVKTKLEKPAQDAAFQAVQAFIAAAQELDLRVAAALSAIKELECIAHGLGLSDPLPPISRIEARSYAHLLSPSSPSHPSSPPPHASTSTSTSTSPPPLRALPLRRALSLSLLETLRALERACADLNALLPRDSPLLDLVPVKAPPSPVPSSLVAAMESGSVGKGEDAEEAGQDERGDEEGAGEDGKGRKKKGHEHGKASIAELLRHDERARQEREELERFNNSGGVGDMEDDDGGTEGSTSATAPVVDPFHPTESTFGGIERRQPPPLHAPSSSLSSLSAASPAKINPPHHHLRESISSSSSPLRRQARDSVGSISSSLDKPETGTPSRRSGSVKRQSRAKRPLSLGGAGVGVGATPMRKSVSAQSHSSSPSPSSPSSSPSASSSAHDDPSPIPYLLLTLQETFDDLHALRRGVIWRLLEALSCAESDRNWNAIAGVVGSLAGRMGQVAKGEVRRAHEVEFGAVAGTTAALGGSASKLTTGPKGSREQEREREKERRRRSGAYARDLLDTDDIVLNEGEETPRGGDGGPGTPLNTKNARRDALARLTGAGAGMTSSNASPRGPPASYANFAPTSSSSASSPLIGSSTLRSSDGSTTSPQSADLVAQARNMALALRAIEAKLKFVVDDGSAAARVVVHHPVSPFMDERKSAVVEMYEGIGADLKRLEEQWRAGRDVLKRAMGLVEAPPVQVAPSADEQPPAESREAVPVRDVGAEPTEEERNLLGAQDAVLQTDSSDGAGGDGEDDPITTRQALLDAALSASLLPPPAATTSEDALASPLEEKVFEAVAGPARTTSEGSKFSREERIRRMKEAREALARGRESLGSSPVKTRTDSSSEAGSPLGSRGGGGGGALAQQKMVGELQEVLREYNRERERGRNVDSGNPAAATSSPPPRSPSAALLPLPVPFPVAGTVASPPRSSRPLPPPPPPPLSSSQIATSAPPVSPQKALPQTPPRSATSPVARLRSRPTPPPVVVAQSPLGPRGTPTSGQRYSVQSV